MKVVENLWDRQRGEKIVNLTVVNGEDYVVDGRLLGVVVLSGLQAAWVASAGNLDGFAIMSVVLLKFRSELNTTRNKT
jgi:hypothetical protein